MGIEGLSNEEQAKLSERDRLRPALSIALETLKSAQAAGFKDAAYAIQQAEAALAEEAEPLLLDMIISKFRTLFRPTASRS